MQVVVVLAWCVILQCVAHWLYFVFVVLFMNVVATCGVARHCVVLRCVALCCVVCWCVDVVVGRLMGVSLVCVFVRGVAVFAFRCLHCVG
jgi:hypothetical protein